MKKFLQLFISGLIVLSAIACKHPGKEPEITHHNVPVSTDDIKKDVFVDDFGDRLEVITNNTTNTVIIHLEGKTYELKKNPDLPEYSASNAEYQYSNVKGDIVFLKKDIDMVLFHHKKASASGKNQAPAKMASY
ncbi:hypothetical protein [Chryseobacterium gossypii]|uniref:hypothetical protein n=1 Tax=Chryseobacterium gossypii TaxID=3231602 RepID=UPI0035258A2A